MATGDTSDMRARMAALLPPWWGPANPIRDALLTAAATVLSLLYTIYAYAKAQTRIATATGVWLDIIAQDFFGTGLVRNINEPDATFRTRIVASLFAPKATRAAISAAIKAVTGVKPTIIEPFSPADCGIYGVGYAGYSAAGAYGSMLLPAQLFVIASRPQLSGIANVAGYGFPQAGYSIGSQSEWADLSMMGGVADADIFAAVDKARAAGVTVWMRMSSGGLVPVLFNGNPLTIDGSPLLM